MIKRWSLQGLRTGLLLASLLYGAEPHIPSIGAGITFSGKWLLTLTLQNSLAKRVHWRSQITIAFKGAPLGLRTAPVILFPGSDAWYPYLSPGADILFSQRKAKLQIHPFASLQSGILYAANHGMATDAFLWLGYLHRPRQLQPLGMGLVHFNRFD